MHGEKFMKSAEEIMKKDREAKGMKEVPPIIKKRSSEKVKD
jgi:hypothetical protein